MKNTIKKFITVALMALMTMTAVAGNVMVAFSTKGPDVYADGTSVQVGECYALVWMRNGFEFEGVDMNGNAVDPENNAVVVAVSIAKMKRNGAVRCPTTIFELDDEFVSAHSDGSFALIVLDTRKANADGELVATGDASNVNGWGMASKGRVSVKEISGGLVTSSSNEDVNGASEATGAQAGVASVIPANEDIPQPKITGINIKNGYVYLTVTGTSPRLIYNIASGATPAKINNRHVAKSGVQGHSRRNGEITIVTPVKAGQNFFKVVRN